MRIQRRVRQWFWRHRPGRRRLCTERLPTVATPWARRTLRLAHHWVDVGLALGGQAGGRLSQRWGLAVSRKTRLRLLRRLPVPSLPPPTGLGVDAGALRKRQTSGTVLLALARRQPVALLPDRTGAPLAQGLREPPGVQGRARDRATASAEGARQGAPSAPQGAARLPLLQHLREALEQGCLTQSHALDAGNETVRQQPGPLPAGAMAVPVPPHDLPRPAPQRAAQRQARWQGLQQQGWALHRQGWTAPAIAHQVGLSRRTVQRDLRTAPCAGRTRRSDLGARGLPPSQPSLLARWHAGCSTARRRFRDLRPRGSAGGDGVVAAEARRWRQAHGLPPGPRGPRQALPPGAEPPCQPWTPRRATGLGLRREAQRTAAEAQPLAPWRAQPAAVTAAIALAQDGATRVRQRQPEALAPWRPRATARTLEALPRFAQGLYEDDEAVKAGVTLPWSTGPVEGPSKRLTMLKRPRGGRVRLALLRRRFVGAPRGGQAQAARPRAPSPAHAAAASPRGSSEASGA